MSPPAPLGYDFVKILENNGAARTASRPEYEALPLSQRISLVLRNQVEFYRNGVKIPSFEALKIS